MKKINTIPARSNTMHAADIHKIYLVSCSSGLMQSCPIPMCCLNSDNSRSLLWKTYLNAFRSSWIAPKHLSLLGSKKTFIFRALQAHFGTIPCSQSAERPATSSVCFIHTSTVLVQSLVLWEELFKHLHILSCLKISHKSPPLCSEAYSHWENGLTDEHWKLPVLVLVCSLIHEI